MPAVSLLVLQFAKRTCLIFKSNMSTMRRYSPIALTKNLILTSCCEKKNLQVQDLKLSLDRNRPLVIMLCWLLAKQKHINKYVDYYAQHGMDVLNVNITPWQLLWPIKGAQVIAGDILRFLEENRSYSPLLLHGFSVGGYVWGEVLVKIAREPDRFKFVVDQIEGQVFDSAADVSEIEKGFPAAVFPKNTVMQQALRKYVTYHLKTFYNTSTCHYLRASQMFHNNLVKSPALLFVSNSDPIGAVESNLRLRESWNKIGIKVFWKCWEKSPHVGHYRKYPQEYLAELDNYMTYIGMLENQERLRAKL